MKPIIMRHIMSCLLFVLMALPLQARQSHTVTSTFTSYSPDTGVLTAQEKGYNWTANPTDVLYYGDTGVYYYQKGTGSFSEEFSVTSVYTVTGTVQSIKLYASCAGFKITAKAGNTELGSIVVGTDNYNFQTIDIPVNTTSLTGQKITLLFQGGGLTHAQINNYLVFTKIEVTYLDPKAAAGLSFSSKTATATVGDTFTPPTLNNPNKLAVSWTSSTPSVASVNTSGGVTPLKDGTTTITASFAGNDDYLAGNASYTLTVKAPTLSAPTFSLAAGTYDAAQSLTLSTTKQGADIYYAIDNGSDQKYTGSISISKSCTVKAYIQFKGYKSASDSRSYVIRQAVSLSFSSTSATVRLGNSFTSPTLNNPSNLAVTWSSSNTGVATVNSSGAVTIAKVGTTTIKASFAGDANRLPASASYTLTVKAPTLVPPSFSLESGSFDVAQSLTLSTTTQGAEIYYCVDNGKYQKYTKAITVNKSCTIYAYTQLAGYKSDTDSRSYILRKAATLSFSPTSVTATVGEKFTPPTLNNPQRFEVNWYSSNTNVAIVTSWGSVELKREGTTVITASFAGDEYYKSAEAKYTLTVKAPTLSAPTFSLAAGTYDAAQTLTLSTTKQDAEIYYAIDNGKDQKYTGPITISKSCTVKAYVQLGEYKSAADSRAYVIRQAASLSFSPTSVTVMIRKDFKAPTLSNPQKLPLTWSSSNTSVATVSEGDVSIKAVGETTITAAFSGNDQYQPVSASYKLIVENNPDSADVAGAYKLWINGVRVTQKNRLDVLGDGKGKDNPSVMFDGSHTLVLSNAEIRDIVSQLPDQLVIFVQGENKVGVNATTPAVHHTSKSPIPLTITTSGNYPGTLTITSSAKLVEGFSKTNVDRLLLLSSSSLKAVYGPRIYPFTNNAVITFKAKDFLISGAGGTSEEIDLSNRVVNNVLFTLRQENEDGFWEDESAMVLNTVMPLNPSFGDGVIGSVSFAENYAGMTFMIPSGEGDIMIDNKSMDGYMMAVKIGSGQPTTYMNTNWTTNTIHYKVSVPSYVYIYNAGPKGSAGDRQRGGKKTTTRIVVRTIVIKPQNVSNSNEVQAIIPGAETVDMNPVIVDTGISNIYVNRKATDSWYNLNGQQMDRPRQRGIYILNGRKVAIK